MNEGKNIYVSDGMGGSSLIEGVKVFLSHRSSDKAIVRAIASILSALDVHYWLDEEDRDLQNAAALGMLGETGLVYAIERGVRHSSVLLGIISKNTGGSWWVPYEIGFSRSVDKQVCFLMVSDSIQTLQLPEYAKIASTYWSVDEIVRWAASLSNHHLHTDLTYLPQQLFAELAKYVPLDPAKPDIIELCKQACKTIELLRSTETQSLLKLPNNKFDWLPTTGGPIRDIAYDLFAPLAFYQLAPPSNEFHLNILKEVYSLPTKHYEIASEHPKLIYHPEVDGWRYQRYITPQETWLQGLRPEQLKERIETFLTTKNRNGETRLTTKEEFKAEFDRVLKSRDSSLRRSLGVLINPLFGFTPEARPVYWRILKKYYELYQRLMVTSV
ncbi:toll/interleukin-1 receptor domain-containing protein [Haliscomenobacter sp.]|uniref:toll/interleukin-1 receptor domain-containing protein n=1 Tax=Haliscomenobacter sp. TaxID=2717303 RepID=UPI003BA8808F